MDPPHSTILSEGDPDPASSPPPPSPSSFPISSSLWPLTQPGKFLGGLPANGGSPAPFLGVPSIYGRSTRPCPPAVREQTASWLPPSGPSSFGQSCPTPAQEICWLHQWPTGEQLWCGEIPPTLLLGKGENTLPSHAILERAQRPPPLADLGPAYANHSG